MTNNLPPGVSSANIPGNDTSWDDFIDWIDREAISSGMGIYELKIAFRAGINSVKVLGAKEVDQFLSAK